MASSRNALLKKSKEALDASDWAAALEAATEAVSSDGGGSYQGWAFAGKAAMGLEDYVECERCYRKAFKLDAAKLPALQGLAELYEATGNAAESVKILKPLVQLLKESDKLGPARRRLVGCAVAFGELGDFAEEAACWGQLAVDYSEAPGADLPEAYQGWIVALERDQEQRLAAALQERLGSPSSKTARVEAEVAIARELCETSLLDEAFGRMSASGIMPSPLLQQKYIQRLELRRSFLAAEDVATNAAMRDAILGCCIGLLGAEPTNLYAMRTAIEILEEDGAVVPPQFAKLWQRAAHSFPMKCDGWVGLADWLQESGKLSSGENSEGVASLLVKSEGSRSVRRYFAQCAISQCGAPSGGAFAASKGFLQKGFDCIEIRRLRSGARLSESRQKLQLQRAAALAASGLHVDALAEYTELMAAQPPPDGDSTARGFVESSMALGIGAAAGELDDAKRDSHVQAALRVLDELLSADAKDPWSLIRKGEILAHVKDYKAAENQLLAAIDADSTSAPAHFWLAKTYWLWGVEQSKYRESKKYCHKRLLQSVKLDASHAATFSLLAELLHTVMGDTEKAMKCLLKAVTLDPDDTQSARALAQHYAHDSKHEELQALCERVLEATGGDGSRIKWAWQRLGVAQQKENDLANSIVSMQRAVRCDQDDSTSWQELANSYYSQGKYACATKVLARILDMPGGKENSSAIYLKGRLHLLLAEIDEAVVEFEALYASLPHWAPATLGLGESLLRRACEEYASGWLRRSTATLARSVELLHGCVTGHPQLLAAWKMLGDALNRFAVVSPAECQAAWAILCTSPVAHPGEADLSNITDADLRQQLVAAVAEPSPSTEALTAKVGLLHVATVAYSWVACGDATSPAAWHDLGVSVHERSQAGDGGAPMSTVAVALLSAAIRLDPVNPVIWSSLGAVHQDPRVSQHALIRSIQLDDKQAFAWESLGALYLRHSQTELAHQAFSEAKRLDPDSPASWTGLARALTQQGKWTDAKFTYVQSLQLDPTQPLALLGFANTVARLLGTDTVEVTDVHAALAAVSQYLTATPDDPHAHNLRGLFFQQLRLPRPAVVAFTEALRLLDGGLGGGSAGSSAAQICHRNLGHACSAAGDHAAAASHYKMVDPAGEDAAMLAALGYSSVMQGDLAGGLSSYRAALAALDQSQEAGRRTAVEISVEAGRLCAAVGQLDMAQQILSDSQATMGGTEPSAALLANTAVQLLKPPQGYDATATVVDALRRSALSCAIPQREYRRLAASLLSRVGRLDLAISHISAVLHMHPDSAEDATYLTRLVLSEVSLKRDSTGAPAPLPLQQLQGLYQRLQGFDSPRIAGAADLPATESLGTKCWRLATMGRLAILLGRPADAVRALQRAVHLAPPGSCCSGTRRDEGREATVLLALSHFLAHAGADGTSPPQATMRLLASAMQCAEGRLEEQILLQLALAECQLRQKELAAARETLSAVESLPSTLAPRMQPLLRGLHARMLARCQAVETGPLGAAAAAYTEAAQLLEAEGMLGGWRELGGLLQIGGASEAAVSPHTPYILLQSSQPCRQRSGKQVKRTTDQS
jgi:tetratricopeptide (TPR) repeat protein